MFFLGSDNGSISFQFSVTFIMFIDIFFNVLYPSYEGFSVTVQNFYMSM